MALMLFFFNAIFGCADSSRAVRFCLARQNSFWDVFQIQLLNHVSIIVSTACKQAPENMHIIK